MRAVRIWRWRRGMFSQQGLQHITGDEMRIEVAQLFEQVTGMAGEVFACIDADVVDTVLETGQGACFRRRDPALEAGGSRQALLPEAPLAPPWQRAPIRPTAPGASPRRTTRSRGRTGC